MGVVEENPFTTGSDWHFNACVNNYQQLAELAEHYALSADALVQAAVQDRSVLDVHVNAICFLYRHSLELVLKELCWKSHYALTGTKLFAQRDLKELGRHRLTELWQRVSASIIQLQIDELAELLTQSSCVQSLLSQIEQHDADSYSFRYPMDKRGGRTHPNLMHVNVVVLYERVHKVLDLLQKMHWYVDYLCQRHEC